MSLNEFKNKLNQIPGVLAERANKGAELLGHFTQQLNSYEIKVKNLVKDFDLKSREARKKSEERLEKFLSQVKKTRKELEKTVVDLVHDERKVLNAKIDNLLSFLHKMKKAETTTSPAAKARPRTQKTARKTTAAKKSSTSRTRKSSAARADHSTAHP
jgi:hypothetical protein